MLRIVAWVLRIAVFLLLLGLAIKNSGMVTLHFFFSGGWELPLVFLVLLSFGVGALCGATVALSTLYGQRREIERLRRRLDTEPSQRAPLVDVVEPQVP